MKFVALAGFAAGRDGWLPIVHHWTQQVRPLSYGTLGAGLRAAENLDVCHMDRPQRTGSRGTDIPQLDQQAGSELLHRISRVRFAVYDNRGIGDSDSPEPRAAYSTAVMAADAVAVLVRVHRVCWAFACVGRSVGC